MHKKLRTKPPVNVNPAPGEAQGYASVVAAPPTLPAITVIRPPSRDLAAEMRADRALEVSEEQLAVTKGLLEELAGERRARPALEPLAPGLPTAAPRADPADITTLPNVYAPILRENFYLLKDRVAALGLPFPHDGMWNLKLVSAPSFRKADGVTVRRPNGTIDIYLNINCPAEHFARNCCHELAHLSDYFVYGPALSNADMERRAAAFVARALTPSPPVEPEPAGMVYPWQAGSRRSYSVGGLSPVHPDYR